LLQLDVDVDLGPLIDQRGSGRRGRGRGRPVVLGWLIHRGGLGRRGRRGRRLRGGRLRGGRLRRRLGRRLRVRLDRRGRRNRRGQVAGQLARAAGGLVVHDRAQLLRREVHLIIRALVLEQGLQEARQLLA